MNNFDHQMGWPVENKGEIKIELKYMMTDTSKGTPFDQGEKAQAIGIGLADCPFFADDQKRQWTMGWGSGYAKNGARAGRFASGGFVKRGGIIGGGPLGYMGEAILPIARDPSGPFCVIAKYPGRNFFKDMTGAVKHADKLLGRHDGAKELLITNVTRVVSREPEPKPPLRVRNPRPGEFA